MKKVYTIIAVSWASLALKAQNSPYIQAVDEYVPAPGQFVNVLPAYEVGDDAATMAKKCTERLANNAGGMVCLGAWGGYITFHFDHPLVNVAGERDFYIAGNAITGNAEAGIVCVSQDENGNGLPDDAWYELSGSADADGSSIVFGYEVTYTKTGDSLDVAWTDNLGNEGSVARNAFHTQEYFPLWLDSPLTFRGTRLPDNAHDTSGNGTYWVLDAFDFGYADNLANADTLGCSFNIEWAVHPESREAVTLEYIDFVRVYTGLQQSCGWIGETSTEITGAMDLHPEALAGIVEVRAEKAHDDILFDLWGRRTSRNKGFFVKNHKLLLGN